MVLDLKKQMLLTNIISQTKDPTDRNILTIDKNII